MPLEAYMNSSYAKTHHKVEDPKYKPAERPKDTKVTEAIAKEILFSDEDSSQTSGLELQIWKKTN